MFATPLTAPLHQTLASHVFGRFMPQSAQPVVTDAVIVPVQTSSVVEDEATPDLAQRVREVGEW